MDTFFLYRTMADVFADMLYNLSWVGSIELGV